ncbi:MAG: glycerate kinase [Cyclobacteriaceae bacterium]
MKIVIAPNAFKGGLDAFEAAEAIKTGLKKSRLQCETVLLPIADGGDGTMEVLVRHFEGELVTCETEDALGRPLDASFGLIDLGRTAIVELAAASGIRHLKASALNPMLASTYGSGLLINKALEHNVNEVVITLGGSATVEGGIGLLSALGLGISGWGELPYGGQVLPNVIAVDTTELDQRIDGVKFTLLCDVDNYLLGDAGAAVVFGPQKGATKSMVEELEAGLSNFADVTKTTKGLDPASLKHGGAAGGCGAFLSAYLDAEILDGSDYLFTKMKLDDHLTNADLVITAEGRIDEQTRHGKGPYAIAQRAQKRNVPTIALAGQIDSDFDITAYPAFRAVFPIGNGPSTLDEAIELTPQNIIRTATQIGRLLSIKGY